MDVLTRFFRCTCFAKRTRLERISIHKRYSFLNIEISWLNNKFLIFEYKTVFFNFSILTVTLKLIKIIQFQITLDMHLFSQGLAQKWTSQSTLLVRERERDECCVGMWHGLLSSCAICWELIGLVLSEVRCVGWVPRFFLLSAAFSCPC